jgi:hypothetical protein
MAFLFLALMAITSPVRASDSQWDGTDPEELGISQEEFQKVKESGMSKSKLLHLLEVGVSPNEYFSEPWKKLGVSESHWLDEKKGGMEDDDIDRSYRRQTSNNMEPIIAFVLPGYHHYRTDRVYTGLGLSTAAVAGIALMFLHQNEDTKSIYAVYPIITFVSMMWSAGVAYMDTRYLDNQDASRFSFDFGPDFEGGAAAVLRLRF